jgi:TonB family protein
MMKPLYLLLLLLNAMSFASTAAAQNTTATTQDTLYYDRAWNPTTAQHASYFRTRIKSNAGWQVADHWLNGRTQMTGAYADDSFKIRAGEFIWYDTAGSAEHRCTYVNNKDNGLETYYYPNGQIRMTGKCSDDKYEGAWTGYYPSGKVSAKAVFHKGVQARSVFYLEDGSKNDKVKIFLSESEYPGGVAQWLRFLNKNLYYPDSAVNYEIEGIVVIAFKVSKDGKASDFSVMQSVDKSLDAEAMRVLQLSGDWAPAVYGGIYCDSFKLQPIVFKLTK